MDELIIHFLSPDICSDFNHLILSYNFRQMVEQPTRVTDSSSTIIDLVITNNTNFIKSIQVNAPFGSDHCPVIFCRIQIVASNLLFGIIERMIMQRCRLRLPDIVYLNHALVSTSSVQHVQTLSLIWLNNIFQINK